MGFALCGLSAVAGGAQTEDAERSFRDAILHKQFVLRNFSGEDTIYATWNGSELTSAPPHWHILGLLTVQKVSLHGEELRIDCTRKFLVRDKSGAIQQTGDSEAVRIEIDLNGTDPAAVLPQLQAKLFYPGIDDALAAIPRPFEKNIPASVKDRKGIGKEPPLPVCDCAAQDTDACADHQPTKGVKPPRPLRVADPEYTDAARKAKLNGVVRLALSLDKTGRISDLWIMTPLGLGLQDQAARSVTKYVFQPASCHGQPKDIHIYVDINFRVF